MEQMDINQYKGFRESVRQLYRSAFPREECVPWWLLVLLHRLKKINLTAWTENGEFCGITAAVTTEKLHYLWYFAVVEEKRAQGAGSRILHTLRQQHPQLALNVEPPVPDAANYAQRLRRLNFYRRNQLEDTGWDVWEVGGQYWILSDRPLCKQNFKEVFRKLSFGFWNVRMKERN